MDASKYANKAGQPGLELNKSRQVRAASFKGGHGKVNTSIMSPLNRITLSNLIT